MRRQHWLVAFLVALLTALGVWSQLPTVVSGTVNVAATATDAGSGVDRVEFYAGAALIGTDPSDGDDQYSVSWDSTATPDGPVTLEARAFDRAGNMASDTKAVTVDNDVPTVTITGP